MGLILDSSVLIGAERQGKNARQTLAEIAVHVAGEDVAMSAITLMELSHGVARADTLERKIKRLKFQFELTVAIPIHPVSGAVAIKAGLIDGECMARGVKVPLSDLLIGVTALDLGYKVATRNMRHFEAIPGLLVVML